MSRTLPLLTLLLVASVPTAGASGELTPLAQDDDGDVEVHPVGAPADSKRLAALDMRALAVGQDPEGLRFLLTVGGLGPDASTRLVGSADYRVHWTQGSSEYLLTVSRTTPAPPGTANVYDANLDRLRPEYGAYEGLLTRMPVDADEERGTMEVVVPWAQLPRNPDGTATLEGLHVASTSYVGKLDPPIPGLDGVRVGDRLPDDGSLQHTTSAPEPVVVAEDEPVQPQAATPVPDASARLPVLASASVVAVGLVAVAAALRRGMFR